MAVPPVSTDGVDVAELLDAIIDGRLDGDLVDVFQAIMARQEERLRSFTWQITVPSPVDGADLVVAEHDLTLDEWCTVEELVKKPWTHVAPLAEARNMRAILTAVFQHRCGMGRAEAQAAAGPLAGDAMLNAVEQVEVARRPLSAGR